MKKSCISILALVLALGLSASAGAIDFKTSGSWIMSFGYGANGNFMGKYDGHTQTGWGQGQDNFEPSQRLRLKLDAIASESLSGTVFFEIGESFWGQASTGAALGSDAANIRLKNAFIDWAMPDSKIRTFMGIQNITTPSMASGNSILNDDVAAVVVNAQISEQIGVTAFWARPYNDNYPGWTNASGKTLRAGYLDNVDAFGLTVPLTFDGVSITPWGMYAASGPNAFRGNVNSSGSPFGNLENGLGESSSYYSAGMLPVGGARHRDFSNANTAQNGRKLTSYGNAWWGGITGDISLFDPFDLMFDFEYGSSQYNDDGRLNRHGWFASLLAQYKLDWATPGIYFWYGSGDDSNPANGSERMPALDPDNANNYSYFAFDGAPYLERTALIGNNMAGTWGIGARLNNISFIDSLTSVVRVNYIGGTNSPVMGKKMSLANIWANGTALSNDVAASSSLGMPGLYMTTLDHALELGTTNYYQLYENFTICLEAGYIALWLDTSDSVWGARHRNGESIPQTRDAWNVNASFVYSF